MSRKHPADIESEMLYGKSTHGTMGVVYKTRRASMSKFCKNCGHRGTFHSRTANGAFACKVHGCGCRDVVEPEQAEWRVTFQSGRQESVRATTIYEAMEVVHGWPYGHRAIAIELDD
jgi:hypothetical protein